MPSRKAVVLLMTIALFLALSPVAARADAVTDVSAGELFGMQKLYAVDDNAFDFTDAYTVDNSAYFAPGSFTRVGYYVELGSNWVWASMDTFTPDPLRVGVPQAGTNIVENGTLVSNLRVETNAGSPVTAGEYANGIIEFWASNYGANGGGLYGSNNSLYDWKDSGGSTSYGHGSFQVFSLNDALTSGNTLFGITRGGGSGIGDQPTGHPDWTFGPGTSTYGTRNLEVWIETPNQIVNGSFESPVGYGLYIDTNFDDYWEVDGDVTLVRDSWGGASDGRQWLSLESNSGTPAPNNFGTVSQTFASKPGQQYLLTFDYASLQYANEDWTLTYEVDGVQYQLAIPSTPTGTAGTVQPWHSEQLYFIATGAMTTLSFTGESKRGGYWGPAIDAVSVVSIPEPSTLAMLLGLGGVALLGYLRRRKRS